MTSRRRSLWPREHGAYVQLLAPLLVAVAVAPSVAGGLIAAGACLGFLAHEPLLVVRGRRGARVQAEHGDRARRRLGALAAAAVLAGGAGVALAPAALPVAAAVGAVAAGLVVLSWRDLAHTLGGELVAATALAGAGAPVAIAGGVSPGAAVAVWGTWALAFAGTVVAVHVVITCHKRRATRAAAGTWLALMAGAGAGIAAGAVSAPVVALAAPLWGAAALIALARPPATRLRTVGVAFAAASTLVAAALVASAHGGWPVAAW